MGDYSAATQASYLVLIIKCEQVMDSCHPQIYEIDEVAGVSVNLEVQVFRLPTILKIPCWLLLATAVILDIGFGDDRWLSLV